MLKRLEAKMLLVLQWITTAKSPQICIGLTPVWAKGEAALRARD
jgi:hypothetical protein